MSDVETLLPLFVDSVRTGQIEVYNEFSLKHELGIFLRLSVPNLKVQFERNVTFFFPVNAPFTKREIDISIFSNDRKDLRYAIELKYPRNGQHPEQMFSFCKDIAFVEELKRSGFSSAALVIFVDDRLFYNGPTDGIYGFFRGGRILNGRITKPTGKKDVEVTIHGSYRVSWKPISGSRMYALVKV